MGEAAPEEGVEGRVSLRGELIAEALVEVGAVGVEGAGEEELRLEGRFLASGSGERLRGLAEGLGDGGHPSTRSAGPGQASSG